VDHYVVRRNGRSIGSISTPSFRDDDVLPGVAYRYLVVAVSASGYEAAPVRVTVKTSNASQGDAAIGGTYSFQMHATSQFGYKKGNWKGTYWIDVEFDPFCDAGCSSAAFRNPDYPGITGVMHRTPDGFAGTASGDWGTTCGNRTSISRFTWDVTILTTTPDNALNQLVADELRATVEVSESATSGCRASGVTFEGTAD
jgi:hypothetical protein